MSDPFEIPVGDEQFPPPDASWKEILEETDWALLRKQKEILEETDWALLRKQKEKMLEIKESFKPEAINCSEAIEAIEGILFLLDHLQDAAANEIGEKKVFDYRCDT